MNGLYSLTDRQTFDSIKKVSKQLIYLIQSIRNSEIIQKNSPSPDTDKAFVLLFSSVVSLQNLQISSNIMQIRLN